MVEVTEADKQMVADYLAAISINMPNLAALILANESALARCFATHREAATKAERDRLRPLLFEAVRQAWFAGRGSNRGKEYDSEAVEAGWNKLIDRAFADALESRHD